MYQRWSRFENLTVEQLYDIMALRQRVFVVEQNCAYLDADGVDPQCWHLMLKDGERLLGYLRIVPPGIKYADASLGRVVTAPEGRGLGLGKRLVEEGIKKIRSEYPGVKVRISAQAYLEKFYTELGFDRVSEPYMEDNIPHIEMVTRG